MRPALRNRDIDRRIGEWATRGCIPMRLIPRNGTSSQIAVFDEAQRADAASPRFARPLGFDERLTLVRDEQVVHVRGMILFFREDVLEHDPRRRVIVPKITDQLLIMLDNDTLGD